MKLALVHDWLRTIGGAERVLIEFHRIFPDAPIYTLFYDKKFVSEYLPDANIRTSFLQKVPLIRYIYTGLGWLMPAAIESLDFSDYDKVLSSSAIFSKGIVLKPATQHICYCYSPTRFLWDRHSSEQKERKGIFRSIFRHLLRLWDYSAADRVDEFVTSSKTVQKRIQKYYRKDSLVIHPPVTFEKYPSTPEINLPEYYLIVSRLYTHKNIDIAIQAFRKLGHDLLIIGDGPLYGRLTKQISGDKNIRILRNVSDKSLASHYANCKALIMPQEEDFGLVPLEAMLFGKPVVALRKGGATEIVLEGKTGEFFDDPIPEGLADALRRLNSSSYSSELIKARAREFSKENFEHKIRSLIYGSSI